MKVIFIVQTAIYIFCISSDCFPQDAPGKKGSSIVTIGHDLARPVFGGAFASPGTRASTKYKYFIPVIAYEYGISKRWSIGSRVGYSNVYRKRTESIRPSNSYTLRERQFTVSTFANYHLIIKKKAELYAGAGFGYKTTNFEATGSYVAGPNTSEFSMVFKAGYRCYFSKHFGAVIEGEYQPFPSLLLAGVVYRF